MEDIKKDIKDFIIENFLFGDEDEIIENDASLMDNGIIDSTGVLELIAHVESNYSIKVENDEILPENLDSLDKIAQFVNNKMN